MADETKKVREYFGCPLSNKDHKLWYYIQFLTRFVNTPIRQCEYNTLVVELSRDSSSWNINTAGIFNKKYASGNNMVYSRHTQTNQNAETGEGSLDAEQGGTQTKTSTKPSTSDGKGTKISGTGKEKVDESSEVTENKGKKVSDKKAGEDENMTDAVGENEKLNGDGYPLTPQEYTTKNGKVIDMFVMKFGRKLSMDGMAALKADTKACFE